MCTLRNFPNQIEHCIEWGRSAFNDLFVDKAAQAVDYLEKPQVYLVNLKSNHTTAGQIEELKKIQTIADLKKVGTYNGCVEIARNEFEERFHNQIVQLVTSFPKDYRDKDGNLFWSGPKRCPHPIRFDASNPTHILFVQSCANLIASNIGIAQVHDLEKVREVVGTVHVKEFQPRQDLKIEIDKKPEEEKKEDNASEDDFAILDTLRSQLDVTHIGVTAKDFHPVDFEKDDDSNFHIDFIHATAQLRAENYDIKPCD